MQIHKSCEISDLKIPFCSSVDPVAVKNVIGLVNMLVMMMMMMII
jgi:hypothetical protein